MGGKCSAFASAKVVVLPKKNRFPSGLCDKPKATKNHQKSMAIQQDLL